MKITYRIAMIAALALSACQQRKPEPAPQQSQAVPDAKPGIAVAAGRLVLPAVAGNPGAAYFQIDNRAGANAVVAAVAIDGATKAEIHQTVGNSMMPVDRVEIAPGTSIEFQPGNLHVMVFDLAPRLKAGATTEMTVTFADGDKISAPLKIEPAGGGGGMGAMDDGAKH